MDGFQPDGAVCGITEAFGVTCWGNDWARGALANATSVVQVAVGADAICALHNDGSTSCMGKWVHAGAVRCFPTFAQRVVVSARLCGRRRRLGWSTWLQVLPLDPASGFLVGSLRSRRSWRRSRRLDVRRRLWRSWHVLAVRHRVSACFMRHARMARVFILCCLCACQDGGRAAGQPVESQPGQAARRGLSFRWLGLAYGI